jgi:RNA 2',3'-cyclic 3'-phosphodiesterase
MPETIRAFIACELPASVIALLANLQRQIKSNGIKAKWVRPENIHLTLKFLGNIQAGDIDRLVRCMTECLRGLAPITLMTKGIGVFPGIKRARVIWVGLAGQIPSLVEMQRKLEESLATMGFPKENRAFKGHLTLCRITETVNPGMIGQIIRDHAGLQSDEFTVNAIDLVQSTLHPTGSMYTRLRRIAL